MTIKHSSKIKVISSMPEEKDIISALDDIKKKLGLRFKLNPKERKMIASMAENRIDFVKEVIQIVKLNPKIINGSYNIDQLKEKLKTTLYFLKLSCEAEKLTKQLYDYSQIIGSDTYKEALLLKKHIKTTCELNPKYKESLEKLNKYFSVSAKNKTQKNLNVNSSLSPCLELKNSNQSK